MDPRRSGINAPKITKFLKTKQRETKAKEESNAEKRGRHSSNPKVDTQQLSTSKQELELKDTKKALRDNARQAMKTLKASSSNENEITSKVIAMFKTITSLCSLEVKLRLKNYSISLQKTGGITKLVQCRLLFDAEKNRIGLRIKRSVALALFIPPGVVQTLSTANSFLKRIPLGNKMVIFKLFTSLSNLLTSVRNKIDVKSCDLDDRIVEDDFISVEEALKTSVTTPSKLLTTLSTLNVKILCAMNVEVVLKRRQVFAQLRRQMVVMDTRQGLHIVKEPRAILRSEEVSKTLGVLYAWVTSQPNLNTAKHIFEVVKSLRASEEETC